MTPEQQASLLAEWLEKPPGTDPPQGVDLDALEAIFALRPDLAPAPRVGIDDILAGVSTGPFARTAEVPVARTAEVPISETADVIQAADPQTGRGEVVDFAAARKRRTRVWGAVGTMAAAALILFTVLPSDDGFENVAKDTPVADPVAQSIAPAAPPALDEAQAAEDLDRPEAEPAPARQARQELPGRYDALQNLSSADVDYGDLDVDDVAVGGALEEQVGAGASYGPPPEDQWNVDQAPAKAAPAVADLGYVEAEEDEIQPSGSIALSDAEYALDGGEDVSDEIASLERRKTRGWSKEEQPKTSTRSSSGSSSKASSSYGSDAYDADADAYDAPAAEPDPIPSDLDALRAAAYPSDYSASWYLRALDDDGLDRVDTALSANDFASLINDADPRVGQDFAARAAEAAASSSASTALGYVQQGLRRSSANTPFLSRLYLLQGQLLEAQGDVEGAKAAYTTAANLNRAR